MATERVVQRPGNFREGLRVGRGAPRARLDRSPALAEIGGQWGDVKKTHGRGTAGGEAQLQARGLNLEMRC